MLTSTISQCADALQRIVTHAEHPPPRAFAVKSKSVQIVLDSHSNEKGECVKNKMECAHANLHSNVLSPNDMCSLINYGIQNQKWTDYTSSLTTMTQTKIRREHVRDTRLCDLRINFTHGPLKHGSSTLRWPTMTIIDQKHRTGKIALSAKKSRAMHRHRDWLLDGSDWLSCSLTHKLNNGEHLDLSFNHPDSAKNPS